MGFLLPIAAIAGEAGVGAAAAGGLSTLSMVGIGASALGAITGAFGSMQAADAQSKQAQYQAQVADNNAIISQNAAKSESATAAESIEQQGLKTRSQVGAIKAAQGASNIDVNSGSAVDVRSSAAELGELNALTIRSNAEKQIYGLNTQASSYTGQATVDRAAAANASSAGGIGAFGSILSGVAGVSNQYNRWKLNAGASNPTGLAAGDVPLAMF